MFQGTITGWSQPTTSTNTDSLKTIRVWEDTQDCYMRTDWINIAKIKQEDLKLVLN